MLVLKRLAALAAAVTPGLLIGGAALAGSGQPSPWQMGFQQAATPVMENIVWFHDFLLWLIIAITLFVLALLVIVVVRFNSRANPTPSRTTHNTLLEVMWTLVPVIILVAIAVPSFKLLFLELTIPQADVTVKATGKQWYWSYSYPDAKFEFDSLMLKDNERKADQPRLLAVDNEMVVPVNKTIRVQVIGSDVIHAFAVPSFGVKIDAVPGPAERDLVQGHPRRRLLRPMLRALRPRPRLYADRGAGGERPRLHRLARSGEEEVRHR